MNARTNEPVITSYAQAPTRTITVGATTYAYRELGPRGGIPVVFFVHLAATSISEDQPFLSSSASITMMPLGPRT